MNPNNLLGVITDYTVPATDSAILGGSYAEPVLPTGWRDRDIPNGYLRHWQRPYRTGVKLDYLDVFVQDFAARSPNWYQVCSNNTAAVDGVGWVALGQFQSKEAAVDSAMEYMQNHSIMAGDRVLLTAPARLVSEKRGVTIHNIKGCKGRVLDHEVIASDRFVVELDHTALRYLVPAKRLKFLEAPK